MAARDRFNYKICPNPGYAYILMSWDEDFSHLTFAFPVPSLLYSVWSAEHRAARVNVYTLFRVLLRASVRHIDRSTAVLPQHRQRAPSQLLTHGTLLTYGDGCGSARNVACVYITSHHNIYIQLGLSFYISLTL